MADKFQKAVDTVNGLPKDGPIQPSQDDKLVFYANFKQATVGDNETTRPGLLDFVGKAKWDAWSAVKGTSEDEAKKAYVAKLIAMLEGCDDEDAKKYLAELQ